jgi:thiamine-phosphate pyrophosphorylase
MSHASVLRILDASLNRATEGLRVAEDYVRFVLDDPFLTTELKTLRHELAATAAVVPSVDRHAARETQRDVGTAISTNEEGRRSDAWSVCAASLKRAEQSLRSLEEYGKLVDMVFAGRMESLRYRLYTLEKAIDVGRASRERLDGVRLCVLVDGRKSAREFERLVSSLIGAGVGMIQLRDKRLDDRELVERARTLVSLTRHQPPAEPGADVGTRRRTLAIINDRADIAAVVQADGVHIGQEDLSVKDARAVVGTRMLIGVSTHRIEQARAAVLDGADYLGAGPTFPSRTKEFDEFAGLDYLRQVSAEIRLPTFAIGGIGLDNVSDVVSAGCGRVAVGAAVVGADDPARAAGALMGILDGTCGLVRQAAEAAAPSLTSDL